MAKKNEQKEQEQKRLNPVMEFFAKFRGTLIINDPALLL